MSDEQLEVTQKALRHRATLLASLLKSEAFQMLGDETARKAQRMADKLAARILNGKERVEVIQSQVDYDRGFIDGMRYIHAVPAGAERKLQRQEQVQESSEPEDDFWGVRQ